MTSKFFLLIATTLFFSLTTTAQAQAIFFEIGVPGLASVNYDLRFTKSESGFGGRISIGGFSISEGYDKTFAIFIPIGVNYLLGKDERNYFEIGGGITPVIISNNNSGSGGLIILPILLGT